ncbi:MAG: putative CocE/NonD family hydrolase [Verrucomicrobiales bacterium]|jgi:putative CocE/NonD family hydrolase
MLLWMAPVVLVFSAGAVFGQEIAFELGKRENVMMPMRDGVRLDTDVYIPARNGTAFEGRFPVVLSRSPYGKSVVVAKAYVPSGYVVVLQNTRGRGGSEGTWRWMSDDRQDGYDAIEWIAAQPWSNGKIGMVGGSYNGATQHLAAMAQPPHLTTIVPSNPSINHGIGGIIYGGAFRLRILKWFLSNSARGSRQAKDPAVRAILAEQAENWPLYFDNLPLRRGLTPLRLAPEYENALIEMMEHRRNGEFWRFNNIIDHVDEHKDLPVLMIGGWCDLFSSSTTETYMALKRTSKAPVHLLMGPWPHAPGERSHGQVDFGPEATVDLQAVHRAWLDRWLRDADGDFGRQAPFRTPARIFVMGTGDGHKTEDGKLSHGGYWRDEPDYPPPDALATKYYLHHDGELATKPPAQETSSTTFEFDPKNPVPTIGGCTVGSVSGAWNQWGGDHVWNSPAPLPLSVRNDIVVFMTPPLEEDTEIIGPISVKLWASSSAVDTDFTAKLIDVYPPSQDFPAGFDLIMGDGIIRARFRDSDKEEKMMTPGEIYEFTIKLDPCSNVFKKGHRIRVDISSSNFPRFDVNSNSGEPPNNNRRMITAVNTIYHNSKHSSHIVLPLMPAKGN